MREDLKLLKSFSIHLRLSLSKCEMISEVVKETQAMSLPFLLVIENSITDKTSEAQALVTHHML